MQGFVVRLSASQVAKLDFLERHLQLLGDCLVDATSSHPRPFINKLTYKQQQPRYNSTLPLHLGPLFGQRSSAEDVVSSALKTNQASPHPAFFGEPQVAQPFARLLRSCGGESELNHRSSSPHSTALHHLPRSDGEYLAEGKDGSTT